MDRAHLLRLLTRHKPFLAQRFGLTEVALLGSVARGTARADNDMDVLVAFDDPASSRRYFCVRFWLEDLLGRPLDLVTQKGLRGDLRPCIEREAVSG